jgi:hypothetical protein
MVLTLKRTRRLLTANYLGFGGAVVDEKRRQPKVIQGNGPVLSDKIRAENSLSTSSCAACMYCTLLLRRARLGRRIFLHF